MLNVYQLYNRCHPCITARRLHHGSLRARARESGCNLGSFLVSHFVLVKWSRKWNRKPQQSESSRCKCSTSNLDGPFAGYSWQVKLRPPPMLPRTLEPPPISSTRISDILWLAHLPLHGHVFPFMDTCMQVRHEFDWAYFTQGPSPFPAKASQSSRKSKPYPAHAPTPTARSKPFLATWLVGKLIPDLLDADCLCEDSSWSFHKMFTRAYANL